MVSVIIPIYNAQKYIVECVKSVLEQDYKDFEIILVDDGSNDHTKELIGRFIGNYHNIHYFYQENSGVSVARNLGLEHATGEYITFVDADDLVKKNMIYNLVQIIEQTNADIAACSCTVFDKNCQYDEHFFQSSFEIQKENKDVLLEQLIDMKANHPKPVTTAIGVPWGKIYRSEFLKRNYIRFNPTLRRAQDNIFNMYAFKCAKKIYYLNQCLYLYRKDHINSFKNSPEQMYTVLLERKKFFLKYPDSNTERIHKMLIDETMFYLFISLFRITESKGKVYELKKMTEKPIYQEALKEVKFGQKRFWMSLMIRNNQLAALKQLLKLCIIAKKVKNKIINRRD